MRLIFYVFFHIFLFPFKPTCVFILGTFLLLGGSLFLEDSILLAQSNPKKNFARRSKKATILDKGSFELQTPQSAVLGKYVFHKLDSNQLFIQTDPLTGRITNPEIIDYLKRYTILNITLIYTNCPRQTEDATLQAKWTHTRNQKRLAELYRLAPYYFTFQSITWGQIEQLTLGDCSDYLTYAQGFVVTYLPLPTVEEEMNYLKKIVKGEILLTDSTVFNIFNRNNHQWSSKNTLIVADVTGSMSPYMAGLVLWLNMNIQTNPYKKFVFFNDDDLFSYFPIYPRRKKRRERLLKKQQDKTGMVLVRNNNFDVIFERLLEGMQEGAHVENVIEAILHGLDAYPDTKQVILIADHWESPWDSYLLPLLKQRKVPVRVILCGVTPFKPVNRDYLDIAIETKGSFHTLEDDLSEQIWQQEGKIFTILGYRYRIERGDIIFLNN